MEKSDSIEAGQGLYDRESCDQILEKAAQADKNKPLIIDLAETKIINSFGIQTLLKVIACYRSGGKPIVFVVSGSTPHHIFQSLQLDKFIVLKTIDASPASLMEANK